MIPHFDLPFRFGSHHHAVEIDQDSLEDITHCVQAAMLTHVGQRMELPDFGIPDLTFQRQPVDLDAVMLSVIDSEPRAHIVFSQAPDRIDSLIAHVTALVNQQEVAQ